MANDMTLIITLRKDVPDTETAESLANTVKQLLVNQPTITVTASVSKRIEPAE